MSEATVSRVLNHPMAVAESTRRKVESVIVELDYRPSSLARGLSRGRSSTVAVVAAACDDPATVSRIQGVASRLREEGFELSLYGVHGPEEAANVLNELADPGRAAAVILVSLRPTPHQLGRLAAQGTGVVTIGAELPDVSSVTVDDFEGGRIAARHLVSLGHRMVAFIGNETTVAAGCESHEARRRGFEKESTEADIGTSFVHQAEDDDAVASIAAELLQLDERPTAIAAVSDGYALAVLGAAGAAGFSVPGDVSVIGFDDIDAARAVGLSTVRQPLRESGRLAAELALECIEQGIENSINVQLRLPVTLVERNTTAPV